MYELQRLINYKNSAFNGLLFIYIYMPVIKMPDFFVLVWLILQAFRSCLQTSLSLSAHVLLPCTLFDSDFTRMKRLTMRVQKKTELFK
jgi:hypothetical protein